MIDDVQHLQRITMDPDVMSSKPCIRGMRVTVGMIVESIAAGRTTEDLLTDFPYLQVEDIREAARLRCQSRSGREFILTS
jgi:uncharacterized protein (DUF433 family)